MKAVIERPVADLTDRRPAEVRAEELVELLWERRHRAFVGVPCSLLSPMYDALTARGADVFPASREDLGIGVATGLALAGRRPVVLMQNSGLAGSAGALLSLPRMYRIGMTLVVSWRGCGPDAPEHVEVGANTPELLDVAALRWTFASSPHEEVAALVSGDEPVALLVRQGELT